MVTIRRAVKLGGDDAKHDGNISGRSIVRYDDSDVNSFGASGWVFKSRDRFNFWSASMSSNFYYCFSDLVPSIVFTTLEQNFTQRLLFSVRPILSMR